MRRCWLGIWLLLVGCAQSATDIQSLDPSPVVEIEAVTNIEYVSPAAAPFLPKEVRFTRAILLPEAEPHRFTLQLAWTVKYSTNPLPEGASWSINWFVDENGNGQSTSEHQINIEGIQKSTELRFRGLFFYYPGPDEGALVQYARIRINLESLR